MSVARVTYVKKSRKAQRPCTKCGDELPVGSAYLYWEPGFRSHHKVVRCMKPECAPSRSERESSALSGPMAAQEAFEAATSALDMSDEGVQEQLQSEWESFREAVREYADEARQAAEAWEYGNSQLEERADEAEGWADEMEGFDVEEFYGDAPDPEDYEDGTDDPAYEEAVEKHAEEREAHYAEQLDTMTSMVSF